MSMQELVTFDSTPAALSVDFEILKNHLKKELEKYNIVVTADTVADSKKLATQLNATKNLISDARKAEVSKASVEIKAFDSGMKELESMCETDRQKLLDQVQKFEDETKKKVEELLTQCRTFLFDKHSVKPEFYRAEFDDLVKVTALTAGGKLTKSVKDQLQYRVLEDKALQDQTERRLLELENISLKAGLSAPLTQDHVKPFLFADDDYYQSEVERIIAVEIERQEQAEIAARKKLLREQEIAKAAAPEPVVESEPEPTPQPATESEPVAAPEPPAPPASGKVSYEVMPVFHIDVDPRITTHQIDTEIRRKLAQAGLTKLSTVYVKPMQSSAA